MRKLDEKYRKMRYDPKAKFKSKKKSNYTVIIVICETNTNKSIILLIQ